MDIRLGKLMRLIDKEAGTTNGVPEKAWKRSANQVIKRWGPRWWKGCYYWRQGRSASMRFRPAAVVSAGCSA